MIVSPTLVEQPVNHGVTNLFSISTLTTETAVVPTGEQQQPIETGISGTTSFAESSNVLTIASPANSRPISDPYPDTTPQQLLNRTYQVASATWVPGWAGLNLFFPGLLLTNPTISGVLKRYRFLRADVQVEIKINSTPFHQGALIAGFLPCHSDFPTISVGQHANFLSGVPNSVIMSASTQDSVKMDLPWLNPVDWWDSYSDSTTGNSTIGTVAIREFNALVATSAGQSPSVPVLVFASFKNIRTTGFVSDSAKPNTESHKKAEQGIDAKGAISTVSAVLRQVPVIGNTYGMVADAINSFAGNLSKPISNESPHPQVFDANINLNMGHGITMATPLSLYPNPQLSQEPVFAQMETSHATISSLAQRPMVYARSTLSPTNTSINIPILVNTNYLSTPSYTVNAMGDWLATTSRAFKYWRGSIKYLIHVNVPSFYSFRMRMTLRYKNTFVDLGDLQSKVVDIKGETWVQVSVPYLNKRMYLALDKERVNVAHPWLSLTLETPIIGSTSILTPFAYINIFRAGGEDIQFAQLKGVKKYVPLSQPTSTKTSEWKSDSSPGILFQKPFETLVPGVTQSTERNYCMSELPQTISDCLKRPSYHKPATPFWSIFDMDPSVELSTRGEPFHYFSALFLFWRGSLNVQSIISESTDFEVGSITTVSPGTLATVNPTYGDTQYRQPVNNYSTTFANTVNIPYFSVQPWQAVRQPGPILDQGCLSLADGTPTVPSQLHFTTGAKTLMSAGDDFILMYPMPYFPWYWGTDFSAGFCPTT